MRQRDEGAARIGERAPRELVTRLRQHRFAVVPVHAAEPFRRVVLRAGAAWRWREHVDRQNPTDRRLHRNAPAGRAASPGMTARVVGMDAQREHLARHHRDDTAAHRLLGRARGERDDDDRHLRSRRAPPDHDDGERVNLVSDESGGWTLVDTGLRAYTDWIRRAARELYRDRAPSAIVLTHGHFDHIGGLPQLADEWQVPVYAHPLEMPVL